MYRVIIVDDEERIRERLLRILPWEEMGLEVVGEAQDGREALSLALERKPDIIITDICIPYIDGLKFVEILSERQPDTLVIVITGHDDFNYALSAIKLKVFDFILKPVIKDQLYSVMSKACSELDKRIINEKYLGWAKGCIRNDLTSVKERFLNDWVKGNITSDEFMQQKDIMDIDFDEQATMFVIAPLARIKEEAITRNLDKSQLMFQLFNTISDKLGEYPRTIVFKDDSDNIVAIVPVTDVQKINAMITDINETVSRLCDCMVSTVKKTIVGGYHAVPIIYLELITKLRKENDFTPIVNGMKQYIMANYSCSDFSVENLCEEFKISRTYAWKLLKAELGISFRELLSSIRIAKATELMGDPVLKLYEIADKVGFNSQHYFSLAFKKELGISPEEYRKKQKNQARN